MIGQVPGFTDDENRLVNRLYEQLAAGAAGNQLRESYYDGKRAVEQVGSIIPQQYYNLALTLGWSAKSVDYLARRCNLDGFFWPDGDLDSLGYREVWENNFLGAVSNASFVSTLTHGPAFLVNTLGVENEPASLIHVKDANSATGDWNTRTWRMDNLLSVTSRDDLGMPSGFILYLRNRTATATKINGRWTADWKSHSLGVPVEAQIYQPSIRRPWGYSRISRPVMSIHDRALRTLVRMEGHADIFSYPEMWMLGADMKVFRNEDGSLKPSWQVMLGRIKGVPDDPEADPALARAEIKQFQAHSPQPHIDLFQQIACDFSGETDVPVTALGVQARTNTTTADGSDNAAESLIQNAENTTENWKPAWRRAMLRALAIQNGLREIPQEWMSVDPKFRDPRHLSKSAQADAGLKQLSAVPWLTETEVGLELLGLSEQQIVRAMSEKRRASVTQLLQRMPQAPAQPEPVTDAGIGG